MRTPALIASALLLPALAYAQEPPCNVDRTNPAAYVIAWGPELELDSAQVARLGVLEREYRAIALTGDSIRATREAFAAQIESTGLEGADITRAVADSMRRHTPWLERHAADSRAALLRVRAVLTPEQRAYQTPPEGARDPRVRCLGSAVLLRGILAD